MTLIAPGLRQGHCSPMTWWLASTCTSTGTPSPPDHGEAGNDPGLSRPPTAISGRSGHLVGVAEATWISISLGPGT